MAMDHYCCIIVTRYQLSSFIIRCSTIINYYQVVFEYITIISKKCYQLQLAVRSHLFTIKCPDPNRLLQVRIINH